MTVLSRAYFRLQKRYSIFNLLRLIQKFIDFDQNLSWSGYKPNVEDLGAQQD